MSYGKETDMAIGVLIKYVAKEGNNAKVLLPHIIELGAQAVRQPGYISGETFFHLERTEECLVISRWTGVEHWQQWLREPRRTELHENINKDVGTKITYEIYGVGLW
jgi:heme-degrading monooxygenase HmoA